jgi:chromosome segregation ATPase
MSEPQLGPKLEEALARYAAARDRVITAERELTWQRSQLKDAQANVRAIETGIDNAEAGIRNAKAALRTCSDAIAPLIHADVAGICGKDKADPVTDLIASAGRNGAP